MNDILWRDATFWTIIVVYQANICLLYGVKCWTLKHSVIKKLVALEMWLLRRINKISWTQRKTNIEVLNICNMERSLIKTIKKRKTEYFGHVVRNEKYKIILLAIEGKIEGKRGVGRRRISWLRNIRDWLGITHSVQLIRAAQDKDAFREMITNLL